ncbi:hypothetical protein TcBrA4_0086090 [Trypanosoma cruzi]|nr:hypothetical protein TcBrA4_0086090 [Trypanosoma cruzi]
MYPKNKPLPPEAASRAACLSIKKENEKAKQAASGIGVSGLSANSGRKGQSEENSTAASSPHHSSRSSGLPKQNSRNSPKLPMPPSYLDSLKGSPLYESNFINDGVFNGGANTVSQGNGVFNSNKNHMFLPNSILPPPYEISSAGSNGMVDGKSYDYYCGRGAFPPAPMMMPPTSHHVPSPGMSAEGAYFEGHQMHGFTAPPMHSIPPPPLPQSQPPIPWSMQEKKNPNPNVSQGMSMEPPCYNAPNGRGMHGQASYFYAPNNQNGTQGKYRRNNLHSSNSSREKGGNMRTTEDSQGERGSEKSDARQKAIDDLHTRQLSMESNFLTQVQEKHDEGRQQQDLSLASWRENRSHSCLQHRQCVSLLVQVIVVLLERITEARSALRGSKAVSGDAVVSNSVSSLDTREVTVSAEVQQEEDLLTLKEQLNELQDVLSNLQEEGVGMEPNRRRLLDGIMAFPQLLPLSTAWFNNLEESTSSSSDGKPLTEEKFTISREVASEVKALMKALDFETTRPITLSLVAPSFFSLNASPHASVLKKNTTPSTSD